MFDVERSLAAHGENIRQNDKMRFFPLFPILRSPLIIYISHRTRYEIEI